MNKKFILIMAAAGILSGIAQAEPDAEFLDIYFPGENPDLTVQERKAIDISREWIAGDQTGIRPAAGSNGTARFLYGASQPSIVCAVLQVCDVALQPGESVNSVHLGDIARWIVEPAITGSGADEITHLIIKPMDVGLETSLIVTTDRRAYHMRLRSHRTEYMPSVAFTYPGDSRAKWELIRRREAQDRERKTIPATGEYLGNLSFDYNVSGSAPWKPVRIYNDGKKTIIEMPKKMAQTEAPTLLVVRRRRSVLRKSETVLVNYRIQGSRYVIDTVFDRAILFAGVGKRQQRITITRRDSNA